MDEKHSKTRKKNGRPELTTHEESVEIASLYFDEEWTARRIREERFPRLADDTIRSIARRTRDKQDLTNKNAPASDQARGGLSTPGDTRKPSSNSVPKGGSGSATRQFF